MATGAFAKYGKTATAAEIRRLRTMKKTLSMANRRTKRRAGSPFSRTNLRTLFKSATGTFPGYKTGLIAGKHRQVPMTTKSYRRKR